MIEPVEPPRPSAASRFALRFIQTYRRDVSHRLRAQCRHDPTCSAYALDAYRRHGFFRATAMTIARIASCRRGVVDNPIEADRAS